MGYIFKSSHFKLHYSLNLLNFELASSIRLLGITSNSSPWTWPIPPFLCWCFFFFARKYWTNKLALKTSLKFLLQIWINWELIRLSVPLWHHRDYVHVLYSEWIAASHVWRCIMLYVSGSGPTCSWWTAGWRGRWKRWWCKVKKNITQCKIKRTKYVIKQSHAETCH